MFGGGWCCNFGGLDVCNDTVNRIWYPGFGYKSYFETSYFSSHIVIASGFFWSWTYPPDEPPQQKQVLAEPGPFDCIYRQAVMYVSYNFAAREPDGLLSPHYPNVERLYQLHLVKKHMNSTINEVTKMSDFSPDLVIVRRFGFLVLWSHHFPPSHQVSQLFSYWEWENCFCNGPIFGPQTFPWTYMFLANLPSGFPGLKFCAEKWPAALDDTPGQTVFQTVDPPVSGETLGKLVRKSARNKEKINEKLPTQRFTTVAYLSTQHFWRTKLYKTLQLKGKHSYMPHTTKKNPSTSSSIFQPQVHP